MAKIARAQEKLYNEQYALKQTRRVFEAVCKKHQTIEREITAHLHMPYHTKSPIGINFSIDSIIKLGDLVIGDGDMVYTGEYYRFEGVLLHRGSGDFPLYTPQLCSDEEWADMLNGKIAKKFFHEPGEK